MISTRETIYSGLFDVFSNIDGFATVSRRLQDWTDVGADQQPALFQVQKGEVFIQQKGLPKKADLAVDLYIYAYSNDTSTPPSTILNPLLDAVENLLQPNPGQDAVTLDIPGVSHIWISGKIETDEGILGDQSVCIIPISILAL